MTYSRKRYWLAMGGLLAVAVVVPVLTLRLHPVHASRWAMAMTAVCGALGLLAFFSRDEIQRQDRMRAWYWGGTLAIPFGLAPLLLLMPNVLPNAMLEMVADFLSHASRTSADILHTPRTYFALGIMVTLLAQVIGYYLARFVLRLRA